MRKLVALSIAPVMAASIAFAPGASAAPFAASSAAPAATTGLQLPNVAQIVDCTIALVEQLLLGGRPGSDCFGVP